MENAKHERVTLKNQQNRGSLMVKVIICYDSKYGNTKIAAEKIVEGLKEVETSIEYVKEVDVTNLIDFDTIVLGAPNHMGRPSQTMKKFINKLAKHDLQIKNVAIFGTYAGKVRTVDRAVKKLQKMVNKKLPNLNQVLPTLSIRVKGIRGPIVEGALEKCVDFGKKLANQFQQ